MSRILISTAIVIALLLNSMEAIAVDTLPSESQTLSGYDSREEVEKRLSQLPLHDIEGIWQWIGNDAFVVIERFPNTKNTLDGVTRYRIVVLESPRLSVLPGTVMGQVTTTAKADCFEANIYTDFDGGTKLSKPQRFILTISKRRLSFVKQKSGIKVNLWRMVPYMFRYSITTRKDVDKGLDGCVKIFPVVEGEELNPRYL